MKYSAHFRMFLSVALIALAPRITAAEAPSAILDSIGYGEPAYALVFAWEERCLGGQGPLVHGFRIASRSAGEAFDIYTDETGALLEAADQARLRIRSKDWRLRAVTRDAEVSRTGKRLNPPPVPTSLPLPTRALTLPPIDLEQLLAEDAADAAKGPLRVGTLHELAAPVRVEGARATAGMWQRLLDGSLVWTLELVAPGALGQRIHFAALQCPESARLILYNSDRLDEAYGPLPLRDTRWSPTCFAERVTIELLLPPDVPVESVHLLIDRATQRYRGLDVFAKQAGVCNNDLACFPDWTETGLGVGGIGTVGDAGDLWCTGALVADDDPETDIPYFLTANHCVGSSSEADTIEVYWLYQTPSCDGTPPDPASVPRSGNGAQYLASASDASGTDFSLVRLREAPPVGVTYLGFDSRPVGEGMEVVCIHHPRGDFKRITFGNTVRTGSPSLFGVPIQPYARYHEVLWYDGTTEGGSSGSPLFLASSARIIGQLWGGRASCVATDEPDYFGRFDLTHAIVQDWLGGLTFDRFDLNQSGSIDAADVQLVVNGALNPVDTTYDLDESGSIDALDVQLIVDAVLMKSRGHG